MKIVLIGNYAPDRQESMVRFAQMLENGFKSQGIDSIIWKPIVFFGFFQKTTISGVGKWLGYIDKWIIFPLVLRWRVRSRDFSKADVHFHICDHSNSPYLPSLPPDRTALTCHDVLAIRGALGYKDAFCTSTGLGKVLQKWILENLAKARKIACVSNLTLRQLKEIAPANGDTINKDWRVIHNAFNAEFAPVNKEQARKIIAKAGIKPGINYILHVGSSLPRKNRNLLLDMLNELGQKYTGFVCFAGEALDNSLLELAQKTVLSNRLISIVKPDHITLTALYSACDAFIFPSFSEGFGWPVIEAQACGAPVLASNIEPIPEVSGDAAIHANPYKSVDFAKAFLTLEDKPVRDKLINAGFENSTRFNVDDMLKKYLNLYTSE